MKKKVAKLSEPETETDKISKEATKILKKHIIEFLSEVPIAKYAYSKAQVPKATYYKWRKTDPVFLAMTDEAITEGKVSINELAKSQMIKKIQSGNITACIFWLKHNDQDFNPRIAIEMKNSQPLTKEQIMEISQALRHIGLAGVLETEKELLKKFEESKINHKGLEIVNQKAWSQKYREYRKEKEEMERREREK